tara:strand:+ start:352 stop:1023 length:672 start_codon:yes stop_codon:yes gene_type:complete
MATIYHTSSNDGYCQSTLGAFASVRNNAGDAYDSTSALGVANVQVYYSSARGTHRIRRAFFEFDTSGISIAPSAATLKIRATIGVGGDIIAVRSEQGATLAAGDFNSFPSAAVTALGNSDGSGAGSFAGIADFTYSAEITTWSANAYNDIALNTTARGDMVSLSLFKVCVMNHDFDYLDIAGTSTEGNGWAWSERAGTSQDPYIDYTAGVAVVDNATFFGANF